MNGIALRPGRNRRLDAIWVERDVDAAARRVASELAGSAEVLPCTVFLGARVFPLVVWDRAGLSVRVHHLRHPMLNRDAIQARQDDPQWPTALKIAAFIGVGQPSEVRRELSALRGIARTVGMFPNIPKKPPLIAEEYDLQGTALVSVGTEGVRVHVGGDGGSRPGSDLAPLWKRAFEERLFWWAVRTGCWPR